MAQFVKFLGDSEALADPDCEDKEQRSEQRIAELLSCVASFADYVSKEHLAAFRVRVFFCHNQYLLDLTSTQVSLTGIGYEPSSIRSTMKDVKQFFIRCCSKAGSSPARTSMVSSVVKYVSKVVKDCDALTREKKKGRKRKEEYIARDEWLELEELKEWKASLASESISCFRTLLSHDVTENGTVQPGMVATVRN